MKIYKQVKVSVDFQGGPIVNTACVIMKRKGLHLVEVDMKTKWCGVSCYISSPFLDEEAPGLMVDCQSRSLHFTPKKKRIHTSISFLEYAGWDIWIAECNRYTLRVVLIKNTQQ